MSFNPFERPEKVDREIDNQVKSIIRQMFERDNKIMFHDMVKYYENAITDKDIPRAKIAGFYCVNVINGNLTMSNKEKETLINDLYQQVKDI